MQPWSALRTTLGESPLWCEHERCLYLTDIESRALHRLTEDGRMETHPMPDRVASLALCQAPGLLLLALAQEVRLYDVPTRRIGPPLPVPVGAGVRLNDGRCDPQGRFVVGGFVEAADGTVGADFWRVHPSWRVDRLPLPRARVANALAFTPDARALTWTDSPSRQLHICSYGSDGRLGPGRVYATLDDDTPGMPDGATFDRDGGLWVALFGGGAVLRLDDSGRVAERLQLPLSRPTCPVFTGGAFDRLALSSAHIGLDAATRGREPLAGAVLAAPAGRCGLPAHRFAIDRWR